MSILTSYQLSDAMHFPSADPGPVQNQFRRVWCNFLANILSMQRMKLRKKIERKKFFLPFSLHTCLKNNWSATTHRQINIFSCLQDMSVTFVRRCTYLLLDRNINFNSCSKIPTTTHLSHVVSQWTVTLVHRSCLYLWDK